MWVVKTQSAEIWPTYIFKTQSVWRLIIKSKSKVQFILILQVISPDLMSYLNYKLYGVTIFKP